MKYTLRRNHKSSSLSCYSFGKFVRLSLGSRLNRILDSIVCMWQQMLLWLWQLLQYRSSNLMVKEHKYLMHLGKLFIIVRYWLCRLNRFELKYSFEHKLSKGQL